MAELATPSAIEMNTGADPKAGDKPQPAKTERPSKPDEAAFEAEKEKLSKLIQRQKEKLSALRAKRNAARSGTDQATSERKKQLQEQLQTIKDKQAGDKKVRGTQQDKIKAVETQVRSRIAELNNAKSAVPYRTSEEIDNKIAKLEADVEGAKLKLVDEKKALSEISNLRRVKKNFPEFEAKQKEIDRLKEQISEMKGTMGKSGNKEEDDQFTTIKTELDAIFTQERQGRTDSRQIVDELKAEDKVMDGLMAQDKELKDKFFGQRREYRSYEAEANRARIAREKAERDAERKERVRRALQSRVDEASVKAYLDEIRASVSLIRLLDPSAANFETPQEASKYAASAQRTVTDEGFKGARVVKKDEEDYFVGTGGKKGKKSGQKKKPETAAPADGKAMGRFYDPAVARQFDLVGLKAPGSADEIPAVVEKLKEKREFWLKDQDRKTEENIAQAKKELEDELNGVSEKPKAKKGKAGETNGEASGEANGEAKAENKADDAEPTTNGASEAEEKAPAETEKAEGTD